MISHKGQLDHIITSVIVLFACFIIMALFVSLTSWLSFIAAPSHHDFSARSGPFAAHSKALMDAFLHDTLVLSSGERVSVSEGLEELRRAVHDYRINDARAIELVNIMQTLFTQRYACTSNTLSLLVKQPSSSANVGAYWVYMHYPSRPWRGSSLDQPAYSVNIIDVMNDRVQHPTLYDGVEFSFIDGLDMPARNGYVAWPYDRDFLNQQPELILVVKGEETC